MSINDENVLHLINNAKIKFNQYVESQTHFQPPQAHISIETELNETTKVHIEVQHNGIQYYFESVQEKDINNIYQYLYSQSSVRAKFSNGNTTSLEATTTRVHTMINRFQNKHSPLYLYSGFVVLDSQTENFLGFVNLGGGVEPDTAEMSFMNRIQCWSHPPNVATDDNNINRKTYSGVGTVEACTLLQYAARLKQHGYTINGHPLKAVVATARIDNEGSWKASSKAGLTLHAVGVVNHYGSQLRYQLRKNM